MDIKHAFASSLRKLRKARGYTQEDFAVGSSRTYLSTLERGLKNPTLEKIDTLAEVMGIHPLTLMTLTYLVVANEKNAEIIFDRVKNELNEVL